MLVTNKVSLVTGECTHTPKIEDNNEPYPQLRHSGYYSEGIVWATMGRKFLMIYIATKAIDPKWLSCRLYYGK